MHGKLTDVDGNFSRRKESGQKLTDIPVDTRKLDRS